MPRKLLVGGVHRSGSVKSVKKIAPPTVPTLSVRAAHFKKSPCICADDQLLSVVDFGADSASDNDYGTYHKPPRSPPNGGNHFIQPFYNCSSQQSHPMKKMTPSGGSNGQIHLAHVTVHSQPDSLPSTPSESGHSPCLSKGRLMSGTQASLEDQGIDMNSPGRHSPGGSSGGSSISRHSLSSLDSGRASAPGSEGKAVNRRLSIQSYEGSSPQRRSYHSSSSSIASVGDDLGPGPNVAEMVLHGLPDVEVLSSWLATLHFEEYIPFFLLAGYDMPTITRMTPEDLTAIGITKPNHRRKLKAEIAKLNISDGIPEYKPDSLLEWLQLLRLEEYFDTLCQQNYNTIDKVTDLTWEDLEDIGIQKLGHQKRILLAIKRIEDINHGRRPNLHPQSTAQSRSCSSSSGSFTFPRPSTLVNVQPLHYPCQEIAISTHRPKSSPSTDSIPEMKTFQQSPLREENLFLQAVHNSAQNIATSQLQNGLSNNALSPTRVRSLESLHAESASAMQHQKTNCSNMSGSMLQQNVSTSNISNSMQHQNVSSLTMANSMMHTNVSNSNMNNSMHHPTISTSSMNNSMQQNTSSSTMSNSFQQPNVSSSSANSSFQQPNASSSSMYNSLQQPNACSSSMNHSSQHQNASSSGINSSMQQTPVSYAPAPQLQGEPATDPPKNPTKDWRVTDLDQDYDYECEGTATLNRPKGLVRLRPMAKITAKTRVEIAEAIMDIPDSEFKSLINQSRTLDGWSSLDGSPRHGPSTVPRSATLKRAPPPPPPKRNNSAKAPNESSKEGQLSKQAPKQSAAKTAKELESLDFPPPPSPLPSAVEAGKDENPDSRDELFNNPLFRQRRKDSSESSSSVDASALPFANESVGTIKQKAARPYPSLPMNSSQLRAAQKAKNASENSAKVEHEYDVTPEAISPGDVIDDIENMLANLSDQLDAMLDEEVQK